MSKLLPPDHIRLWLEMSLGNIHCFSHFFLYHKSPRVAIFYPNSADAYVPRLDPLVEMLTAELCSGSGTSVAYLITEGPVGLYGIPKLKSSEIGDLGDIDALLIPEREIYDKSKALFERLRPELKVFWLGDVITDIHFAAMELAPLTRTLVELKTTGREVLYALAPGALDIRQKSPYETLLIHNRLTNGGIRGVFDAMFPKSGLECKYSYEEYWRLANMPLAIVPRKNYHVMADYSSNSYNVTGGDRNTTGVPKEHVFRVHVFGNSAGLGAFLADEDTSSSHLQACLNQNDVKAAVINHCMDAASSDVVSNRIRDTAIEKNDAVVVIMPVSSTFAPHTDYYSGYIVDTMRANGIPTLETKEYFQRPHPHNEVFLDMRHLNHVGNRLMGNLLYDALFGNKCLKENGYSQAPALFFGVARETPTRLNPVERWHDPLADSIEFREYISMLKAVRASYTAETSRIGAIVVNCNPFTLGHRYLIEKAASEVDFLYVFVVEEDRSVFPFKARFELVDKGTADLPNVGVLESGRFIISTLTFPEYFAKGELQGAVIDPGADIELFGQYIAPSLGVTVRFAGTEPHDSVTRQYNETMSRLLPRYGVEFREIERSTYSGRPISASLVRKHLETRNFDEIEKLVPLSTLEYLRSFRNKINNYS